VGSFSHFEQHKYILFLAEEEEEEEGAEASMARRASASSRASRRSGLRESIVGVTLSVIV
jgi:hypothetical protein